MSSLPNSTQVLVVGAGPVGLVTAITLAQLGIEVVIVDASGMENRNGSRAAIIHINTLEEVFDKIGMTDTFLEQGLKTTGLTLRNGMKALMTVDFSVLRDKTRYPFSVLISQRQVEVLLRKKLTELGVQLLSNRVMTTYSQSLNKDGLLVEFEDGSKMHTRYLVGTDGARSTVRKLSNIGFGDPFTKVSYDDPSDSPFYMALGDVILKSPIPAPLKENTPFINIDNFLFLAPLPSTEPDRPGLMWRVILGTSSSKGADITIPKTPNMEYIQRVLDERNFFSERLVIDRLMTSSRYRVRAALAEKYFATVSDGPHAGYILLAGDAAHVHSPVGGQGMNLGVCDAYEVAHAIHAHIQGEPEALTAYAERRHKIGLRVVGLTKDLTFALSYGVGWRKVVRNFILRIFGYVPWFKRWLAWRISGLGNQP